MSHDEDSRKQKFQYEDMTGDPVYDKVKNASFKGFALLGGRIIHAQKPFGVRQPRMVLELGFQKEGQTFVHKLSFNYKKIERGLK